MSRPRAPCCKDRRGRVGRGAPSDDLYLQIEPWPRIGRPPKHDLSTWTVIDRRQERAERRREHIAELNQRAAETDLRLKRLYNAIEAGVADLDDPALKEHIAGPKAIRDQAQADAERASAMRESSGQQSITPAMVRKFARTACERIRIEGGGYRRDHLRALAQRVEAAEGEVRIMGSKGDLLRTLAAASGVKSAAGGVRSSVLKWRRGRDSNNRRFNVFQWVSKPPCPDRVYRDPTTHGDLAVQGLLSRQSPIRTRASVGSAIYRYLNKYMCRDIVLA